LLDSRGFDIWSENYEKYVQRSSKGYPFEGYYEVLNYMYSLVEKKGGSRILDIGVGTGLLPTQMYKEGATIYGIDFSAKMIEIAQEKMPKAKIFLCDFNNTLPKELISEKFNYIISSYAIHHLNDDKKVELIKQLYGVLDNGGSIIIGDVAFETTEQLQKCKHETGDAWDNDENYIVADEMTKRFIDIGLEFDYKQLSSCAGVLNINLRS